MSKEALWDSASDSDVGAETGRDRDPVLDAPGDWRSERPASASTARASATNSYPNPNPSTPRGPVQRPDRQGASERVHPALRQLLTPLHLTRANTLDAFVEHSFGLRPGLWRRQDGGHDNVHVRREQAHVHTQTQSPAPDEEAHSCSDADWEHDDCYFDDFSETLLPLRMRLAAHVHHNAGASSGPHISDIWHRVAEVPQSSQNITSRRRAPSSRSDAPVPDTESACETARSSGPEEDCEWPLLAGTLLEPCRCGRQCLEHLVRGASINSVKLVAP